MASFSHLLLLLKERLNSGVHFVDITCSPHSHKIYLKFSFYKVYFFTQDTLSEQRYCSRVNEYMVQAAHTEYSVLVREFIVLETVTFGSS